MKWGHRWYRVKKEEALMVDDGKLTDIEGALGVGWRACWFHDKKYIMIEGKEQCR